MQHSNGASSGGTVSSNNNSNGSSMNTVVSESLVSHAISNASQVHFLHQKSVLMGPQQQKSPGGKMLKCDYCEYTTGVKESLRCHTRTHTGERPYPCNLCSFRGATRATINRHIRSHTSARPYECNFCSYKAARKDNLQLHIRKLHETNRDHQQQQQPQISPPSDPV